MKLVNKVVLEYLTKLYKDSIKKQDYKIFYDDEKYVHIPIDKLQKDLELSAFCQRNILAYLEQEGYIKTKLGQARSRYFNLIQDNSKELVLRKQIYNLIPKLRPGQLEEVSRMLELQVDGILTK